MGGYIAPLGPVKGGGGGMGRKYPPGGRYISPTDPEADISPQGPTGPGGPPGPELLALR